MNGADQKVDQSVFLGGLIFRMGIFRLQKKSKRSKPVRLEKPGRARRIEPVLLFYCRLFAESNNTPFEFYPPDFPLDPRKFWWV
tara:strand:+ start:26913 stop:27164 length:252 start_codon:yes stop_codon:yes gene_type:complete